MTSAPGVETAAAGHDLVLRPFLDAEDGAPAEAELARLVEAHALPLVRDVVQSCVPPRLDGATERSDVQAGVLLRLTAHLWALRAARGAEPLASFAGYVIAAAHNGCHAFFRSRYPRRSRLRNKVRYVLTRDPTLALWPGERQSTLCGRTGWSGRPLATDAAARLRDARARLGPRPFGRLVRDLVDLAGGPCRLEDLAEAAAHVLGVTDESVSLSDESETAEPLAARLPDPAPTHADQLEDRLYLERLWVEIGALPAHQRAALLLNLRDATGHGMLGLLPLTGIATREEIAATVGLSEARLDELWPRLPVDDEWIAGALGVTRRQVINFRKCARERLARRMRKMDAPGSTPGLYDS